MQATFDLKEIQARREQRFRNSLFSEEQPLQSQISKTQSNQQYVQTYIKCNITPDVIAWKESTVKNKLVENDEDFEVILDDVIESEAIGMKKEFNIFVERPLVSQIKLLSQNYIESSDLIKLPVCGAQGVRLPDEYDFNLYFKFVKIKVSQVDVNCLVQEQDNKNLYGLLICGCIFQDEQAQEAAFKQLTKSVTAEIIFKLLLITVQYESSKYITYIYKLVKQYFYWKNDLLKDVQDPLLQQLIANQKETIEIQHPNIIKINLKQQGQKININTTFLFPVHKQLEMEKNEFLKPLEDQTFLQVLRNADINDDLESTEYPHIYQVKNEKSQKLHLIAIQNEANAPIHIFMKICEKYSKYNEFYVGIVERNYWGTSFSVFDDGYPEDLNYCFPDWIGSKRRKIMQIEYETNILASEPRKFDTAFLNFETKKFETLVTLAPKYNKERDCYQLHFYGRAKVPSARNFQLIKQDDESTIYLLHGKVLCFDDSIFYQVEKNLFNLDFRPPLNIMQAFAVSLCSISSKLLVS